MQPETTPITKADLDAFEQRMTAKLSELFEELNRARRVLHAQQAFARFDDLRQTQDVNPNRYTKEDVPRLVKEARAEIEGDRKSGQGKF